MIPNAVRYPVPFEFAFPLGALFIAVEKVTDFDRLHAEDNQAVDDDGVRLWQVTVMDQDPEAAKFGRPPQAKVKIAAAHQPVPPDAVSVGSVTVRPVAFVGMTATPYVDAQPCKGPQLRDGQYSPHRCRARQAWSFRASAMVSPEELAARELADDGAGDGRGGMASAA